MGKHILRNKSSLREDYCIFKENAGTIIDMFLVNGLLVEGRNFIMEMEAKWKTDRPAADRLRTEDRQVSDERIDEYCRWLFQNEKSSRTIRKYRYYLQLFQQYLDGEPVNKERVICWKAHLKQQFAGVTVNVVLSALNGFFKYLGWKECVSKFVRIKRKIFCPEQKEISRAEYQRLVKTAEAQGNKRLALLLQTVCSTGIRISEIKYITVEAVKRRVAEVECKGRARTIFFTKQLCRMLETYAKEKRIMTGMIFITRTGRELDRSNIWREMKKLGKKAEVEREKIFPHNLRHLFARLYYEQEKDLGRLADILGHSSIDTTRIYTMESGREHLKQLERLNLIVGDTTEYIFCCLL